MSETAETMTDAAVVDLDQSLESGEVVTRLADES